MKKKTLALLLSLVLVIGVAAGGTLAWLLDTTTPVVNTFTDSDINIELTETEGKTEVSQGEYKYEFKMIPGWTIAKDPKVTVAAGSEACYVFVKVEESDNFDDFMTYNIDTTVWTQLQDNSTPQQDVIGVYYKKLTATDAAAGWSDYVLKGEHKTDCTNKTDACTTCPNAHGYVTVLTTVEKDDMNALQAEGATYPTLTFTAYASQLMKDNSTEFSAYEAWTNLQ